MRYEQSCKIKTPVIGEKRPFVPQCIYLWMIKDVSSGRYTLPQRPHGIRRIW